MALRFADSFGHYATADILSKWTTNTTTGVTITTTGARHSGASCLRATGNPGGGSFLTKTLDSQATWIVGFAWRFDTIIASDRIIVQFRDSAVTHCDMRMEASSGKLFFTRNGTAIGSVGATGLSAATWYFLEVKVTIADAASGVASCRINGVAELTQTTLDTRNAGNASANIISFFGSNQTYGANMADLYVNDATGGVNDDYLGDVRVAALVPTGAGNSTQYTPSTGSNWQNVDDATPDGDSTYNDSSTTSHVDLFATSNLPTVPTGNVKGVQFLTYDRKTDAGARTLRHVVRTNSNDYESANITQLDTFVYNITERDVNPNTSAAWTESQVNGMEIGYKLQA